MGFVFGSVCLGVLSVSDTPLALEDKDLGVRALAGIEGDVAGPSSSSSRFFAT